MLHIQDTITTDPRGMQIHQKNDGTHAGFLTFLKERTTGQTASDNDLIGSLRFQFYNDNVTPAKKVGASIYGKVIDASDTTEDADLVFEELIAGTVTEVARFKAGKFGVGTNNPITTIQAHEGAAGDVLSNIRVSNSDAIATLLCTGNSYNANLGLFSNVITNPAPPDQVVLYAISVEDLVIGTFNNVDFHLGTNNTARMTIQNDGLVGIGTLTPSEMLEVENDQNAATRILIDNNTSGTAAHVVLKVSTSAADGNLFAFSAGYTTSNQHVADSVLLQAESTASAGLGLSARGAGVIDFWTNDTKRMTIDSGGDVTIVNELKGSRQTFQFDLATPTGTIGNADKEWLNTGGVSTENKGVVLIRSGSIVGVSILFDVDADTGLDDLTLHVSINDVSVFFVDGLDLTVQDESVDSAIQARGIDTFGSENRLGVYLEGTDAAAATATLSHVVVAVEIVYDT